MPVTAVGRCTVVPVGNEILAVLLKVVFFNVAIYFIPFSSLISVFNDLIASIKYAENRE
jgi:hypothetical protein